MNHVLSPALLRNLVALLMLSLLTASTLAQSTPPTRPTAPDRPTVTTPAATPAAPMLDLTNPISILQNAGSAITPARTTNAGSSTNDNTNSATPASGMSGPLSALVLLTVLSIAPALLVMCTSFTRIVIVLSLLRQAIGTQTLPPSQVIVGLSLFLTFIVMAPTFERINREAILPMQRGEIGQVQAWNQAKQPLRDFMFDQLEHSGNWSDLYMILNYRGIDTSQPEKLTRADVDMVALIPAFILSELKVSFLMGFRLYLPFLVIDMVLSSVLISMGMMMLPPVLVSLPFKLLLFVLVDGWHLVAGSLLHSFVITTPVVG